MGQQSIYGPVFPPSDEPAAPSPFAPGARIGLQPPPSSIYSTPDDDERLARTVGQAQTASPDTAARIFRLQQKTGLPGPVIADHLDEIEQQAASHHFDAATFRKQTPYLAAWLQQDEQQAAIANDDLAHLGLLEWLVTQPQRAFKHGVAQVEFGQLRAQSLFRPLTAPEERRLAELKHDMGTGGAFGVGNSWFRGAVTGAAEQLPNMWGAIQLGTQRALPAGVTAGGAALLLGQMGPQAALPEELVTVPLMFGAGVTAGMRTGAAEYTFQLEAGLAYDEYLNVKDELGRPIDPAIARVAAIATGTANAALEVWGLEKLLEKVPGYKQVTGLLSRSAVKEALRSPTVRGALWKLAKDYAGNLTAETAVEVAQEAVTVLSGEAARAASGVTQTGAGDIGRRLTDTATQSAQAFALLSLPGPALTAVGDLRAAREASHNQTFFTALGEGVKDSKTWKRSPEALQSFIAQATKDGPIKDLYAPVDSWTTYWQSKNLDPAEMATALTGDADAYARARRQGTDLVIPTAAYAAKLAGTEHNAFFANELRRAPRLPNAREAKAFDARMKARAEEVAATPGEPSPARQTLLAELEARGLAPDEAARVADLHAAIIGTLGERAGQSEAQLVADYPIAVTKPGQAVVEARPVRTQAYQDWLAKRNEGGAQFLAEHPTATTNEINRAADEYAGDPPSVQFEPAPATGIPASTAPATETAEQRTARQAGHYAALTSAIVRDAVRQDPTVNVAALQEEVALRLAMHEAGTQAAAESGQDPGTLLRAIAHAGGLWYERTGHYKGEVEALMESGRDIRGTQAGRIVAEQGRATYRGVPGVFREEGLHPERMLRALQQDPRFAHLETINDLLTAVTEAFAPGAEQADATRLPGTEDLAQLGMKAGTRWWERGRGATVAMGDEVSDAVDTGEGDTSFEFSQGPVARAHVTIRNELVGSAGGQKNFVLSATDANGQAVGALEYALVDGAPSISGIRVAPSQQRQGVGRSLVAALQQEFPNATIDWGMTTPDGTALRQAVEADAGTTARAREILEQVRTAPAVAETTAAASAEAAPRPVGEDQQLYQGAPPLAKAAEPPTNKFALTHMPMRVVRALMRLSTRVPEGQYATERHDVLETRLATLDEPEARDAKKRYAKVARESDLLTKEEKKRLRKDDDATLELFVRRAVGNLRWLWNQLPEDLRERAKQWYVGGHHIAAEIARTSRVTHRQAVAVLAVFSPRTDWFVNVANGRWFAAAYTEAEATNPVFTPERVKAFVDKGYKAWQRENRAEAKNEAIAAQVRAELEAEGGELAGRAWRDLDITEQAKLLRVMVEDAHPDASHPVILPEGGDGPLKRNKDGTLARARSGSYAQIRNAIRVLRHGTDHNVLNQVVGEEHKVRSFFDNLSDPTWGGAVTIDTHAVAAAYLKPFGLKSKEVGDTLGGRPKASGAGLSGFNPVVAEAYFRLAEQLTRELGREVLPREVQSVTWEAVRLLFPSEEKTETLGAQVDALWHQHGQGKLSASAVRSRIATAVGRSRAQGGLGRPDWADIPPGVGSQQGVLSARDVRAIDARVPARPVGVERDTAGTSRRGAALPNGVIRSVPTADTTAEQRRAGVAPPKVLFQPPVLEYEQPRKGGGPGGQRGYVKFAGGRGPRRFEIGLFKAADPSTPLHELGHVYLEILGDLAGGLAAQDPATLSETQQKLVTDYQAFLSFLGVSSRDDITTEHHEKFARAFEAYLFEGKAPSVELRSAFASFAAWLTRVYRSIRALNVELSPEVRGLFDRLAASDDAIAAAQSETEVTPLFTDAQSAGMTDEAFAKYQDDVREAHDRETETLRTRVLRDLTRADQAWWTQAKDAMTATVTAEQQQDPAQRAMSVMRTGVYPDGTPFVEGQEPVPIKLSRDALVAQYGKGILAQLPRPYLYAKDSGITADAAAEIFGFSSGDELLKALVEAVPFRQAVESEVDRRMQAQYGDVFTDGRLQEEANAIVQGGEHRQQIVEAELEALTRAQERTLGGRTALTRGLERTIIPPAAVINEAARRQIAATKIRDLRPGLFLQAAQRASKQAYDLLALRQDRAGAVKAKLQEAINLALYREARDTQDRVESMRRTLRSYQSTAARQRFGKAGADYLVQIDALLDRYELARVTQKALAGRVTLAAFVHAQQLADIPIEIPQTLLDEARRINYQDVPVAEFTDVYDAVEHLARLARLKNELLKASQRRTFEEARDTLVGSIGLHTEQAPPRLEFRPAEDRTDVVGQWFATHTKLATLASALDGFAEGGEMWEQVIRPINEAGDAESVMREAAIAQVHALFAQAYPGRELGRLNRKLFIKEIGASLSKEGRLLVALNWGNEDNRQRLLTDPTRQWNAAQVQAILETLDRRDWDFVQGVWDYVDTFWPAIEAKQKRVVGLAPEKVVATAVDTKFGQYRGGYFPLKYDGRLVARAGVLQEAGEATLKTFAAYVSAQTRRGHTEARVDHVRLAVRLDFSVLFNHIDQVIHDLTHHEMLVDVSRLLADPEVQRAIYGAQVPLLGVPVAGHEVYRQFINGLHDIAIGGAPAKNILERAANFLRGGSQVALLGLNVWTALQQPLGMFNGMAAVGPVWVLRGLKRWLRDAATMQSTLTWIHEQSPYMKDRATGGGTQDLQDLRATLSRPGGWFDAQLRAVTHDTVTQQNIRNSFLWHINQAQKVADVPTWLGAYEKHVAHGESAARAVALADQAVREAQGSGRISDLAEVQRGTPVAKLFMTFYSYGNTLFNATVEAYGQTEPSLRRPGNAAAFLGHLSLLYAFPALGTVLLARALGKSGGDDDDDSFVLEWGKEMLSTALNTMVGVREFGGLLNQGVRGYAGPAGTRLVQAGYQLGQQIKQGVVDEGLVSAAANVAGILFRFPAAQVQRTVEGVMALSEGRTHNPAAVLVGAPAKR